MIRSRNEQPNSLGIRPRYQHQTRRPDEVVVVFLAD